MRLKEWTEIPMDDRKRLGEDKPVGEWGHVFGVAALTGSDCASMEASRCPDGDMVMRSTS